MKARGNQSKAKKFKSVLACKGAQGNKPSANL